MRAGVATDGHGHGHGHGLRHGHATRFRAVSSAGVTVTVTGQEEQTQECNSDCYREHVTCSSNGRVTHPNTKGACDVTVSKGALTMFPEELLRLSNLQGVAGPEHARGPCCFQSCCYKRLNFNSNTWSMLSTIKNKLLVKWSSS